MGGLVLCIVVVVLVLGVARTSIGRRTRKAAITNEGENNEEIPMRPINRSNRLSKRKSQIKERVDERMRTEPLDVEGCEYSFVEDYGTVYSRNQEEFSEEEGNDVDTSVKRDDFGTTMHNDLSLA